MCASYTAQQTLCNTSDSTLAVTQGKCATLGTIRWHGSMLDYSFGARVGRLIEVCLKARSRKPNVDHRMTIEITCCRGGLALMTPNARVARAPRAASVLANQSTTRAAMPLNVMLACPAFQGRGGHSQLLAGHFSRRLSDATRSMIVTMIWYAHTWIPTRW